MTESGVRSSCDRPDHATRKQIACSGGQDERDREPDGHRLGEGVENAHFRIDIGNDLDVSDCHAIVVLDGRRDRAKVVAVADAQARRVKILLVERNVIEVVRLDLVQGDAALNGSVERPNNEYELGVLSHIPLHGREEVAGKPAETDVEAVIPLRCAVGRNSCRIGPFPRLILLERKLG